MANVKKFTKAACGHMFKHYERGKDENGEYVKFSNQQIDTARTGQNYNLAPAREISQGDFIRQRCSQVKCLNRKDVNVMCSWVVTAPKTIAGDAESEKLFFAETYKFLSARYGGEQNVVSAHVHMDEVTPHMHFAFVPVVADRRREGEYKVSACEAINRTELQIFHKDLEAHMQKVFGYEIGILNDATREGNKSIDELKRGQATKDLQKTQKTLAKVQDNIKRLQATERDLQTQIQGLEGQVLTHKGLESIKPEKTLTGAIKGVSVDDVQNLKKTAGKYHEAKAKNKMLEQENEQLKRDYARVSAKVPTIQDEIARTKDKTKIKDLERQLDKANKYIARIPEDVRRQLDMELKQEQKQARQEKGFDMGR